MLVKLITHTENPDTLVAAAVKLCYSPRPFEELLKNSEDDGAFIDKLFEKGHLSPFEHITFTFYIEGVSRSCSHQLVRHRIASYTQQSQRYVKADNLDCVVPPSIKGYKERTDEFEKAMSDSQHSYDRLIELGVPKEDARFVLPNAADTKLIITMNARSLFNFFGERCCSRAQWEIRELAGRMLVEVKKVAPLAFKHAGAKCIAKGFCPEAEFSCGAMPTLAELKHNIND